MKYDYLGSCVNGYHVDTQYNKAPIKKEVERALRSKEKRTTLSDKSELFIFDTGFMVQKTVGNNTTNNCYQDHYSLTK